MKNLFFILILTVALSSSGHAEGDISISEKAVGPIKKETVANLATLKKLFPNYDVKNEQSYSEGQATGELFIINEHAKHLFNVNTAELNSNKIFSVEIFSPKYKTPDGFRVGTPVDSLIKASRGAKCFRGMEEKSDTAICRLGKQGHILYTFITSGKDSDASSGDELKVTNGDGRKILSIVWKP
jgi:hypothetical protein